MSLSLHFESYRDSLKRSALEGCEEFAKARPTRNPERYPTAYDYLSHAMTSLKQAVIQGDADAYVPWLNNHQQAMIALFQRMVDEQLDLRNGTIEERLTSLITEKGWKWFKYSKHSVVFKYRADMDEFFDPWVAILPRYLQENRWACAGAAIYDADEMALSKPLPSAINLSILKFKVTHPWNKMVEAGGRIEHVDVKELNVGSVQDWSLNLWPN